MILWNYSGLKSRDTKIYSVGGYNIAGGFSVSFLAVLAPVTIVFLIVGGLLGMLFNISMINPLADNFSLTWLMVWLIPGMLIGYGLYRIQFKGYRLYQYILAYIKPKKVYSNEFKTPEYKFTTISIKTFIKNLL